MRTRKMDAWSWMGIRLSLAALSFAAALPLARAVEAEPVKEGRPAAISQTIEDKDAKYNVTVEPEGRKVEVIREGASPTSPPQLRLRIHRKAQRPLDVGLKVLEPKRPLEPMHYAARIDKWNQNYVGFELQFSFDKKTWKRLGRIFK